MKKLLCMALACLMVIALVACGGSSSPQSEAQQPKAEEQKAVEPKASGGELDLSKIKVGVVMKSYDEFQKTVMQGAEDAGKKLGLASVMCVAPNAETDIMAQVQMSTTL